MIDQKVKSVGIVGAGVMGAGIMIDAAMHGYEVALCDQNPGARETARSRLDLYLARQITKGRIAEADAQKVRQRVTFVDSIADLSHADLVIEAVFERLELKRQIFADIEQIVTPEAILASNTSCLRLSDIAKALNKPDRFCGMHYFSPAEVNPVVELIEGPDTTANTLSCARTFLKACDKVVISCRDQNGFALNRFFCPYTNEAVRLMDAGRATPGQIDQIARETFGVALGPFSVMNIIGTGTILNAVRNLEELGPFYISAHGLIAQGKKNTPWEIDAPTEPLPEKSKVEIAERLTASILLPVLELLEEGTATLDAVDTGARLAFRFEKTPGVLMDSLGEAAVQKLVRATSNRVHV